MAKGNISPAPIKSKLGWLVVKVDDERPFKMPGFEEAKNKLKQDLMTQKIVGYTGKLKETAKIVVQ
jgi:peptidyl-prolyl cis-trans isomerase C